MPPSRSFVWLYMQKISADRVECKLCGAQYSSLAGTSTMRKHIQTKHPEQNEAVTEFVNSQEKADASKHASHNHTNELGGAPVAESQLSAALKRDADGEFINVTLNENFFQPNMQQKGESTESGPKRRNVSLIWHFMSKVAHKEVRCHLCQRHFRFDSSTSNMHRHLRTDHPNELDEVMRGGVITFPTSTISPAKSQLELEVTEKAALSKDLSFIIETERDDLHTTASNEESQIHGLFEGGNERKRIRRKNTSMIWKFMVKLNPRETKCQLCGKEFRFEGSTSNMRKHVQKEHPQEYDQLSGEGSVQPTSNSTFNKEYNGVMNELGAFEKTLRNSTSHGNESAAEQENASDSDPDYSPHGGSVRNKSPARRSVAKLKSGAVKRGKIMKQWRLKRKNASVIWQFMARVHPKGTMCQLCKKQFSFDGSTTNMYKHLQRDHTEELKVVMEGGTIDLPFQADDFTETKQEMFPSPGNSCFDEDEAGFVGSQATRYFFGKKPTSLIWRFMERISSDRAVCQICKREFNYIGSTSNMRKHLKFSHPQAYSKGMSLGSLSWNSNSRPNFLSSLVRHKGKTCMSGSVAKQLDNMVLMAVGNIYPCSLDLVGSKSFLQFIDAINPNFLLPNEKTMKDTILKLHRKYVGMMQKEIEKTPGISISAEIWTYRERQTYMTVTGHFVSDMWEFQSIVLKTVSLGSSTNLNANIADKLKEVFEEWNVLEKVKCIVSNSVETFSSAAKLLNKPYLQCSAYSLDMIIRESLKASNDIEYLAERVRNIADFFLESNEAAKKLDELLISVNKPPLKLVLPAKSDWIGTHKMFKNYIELHNTMRLVLQQINKEDILLVAEELELANRCIQVLEPFTLAAEEMMADCYTVLSKSLPLFEILRQMTANSSLAEIDQGLSVTQLDSASGFIKELSGLVDKCLSVVAGRNNFLPWGATLLDPRFKHIVMENPDMQRWVESELRQMIEPNKGTTENESQSALKTSDVEINVSLLWSSFDESIKKSALEEPVDELQRYIEERPIKRQECPFKWWMEREHLYPKLCKVVRQFLCIPATAIPAKQIFSEKEKMKMILRNFLEEPYIDSILFLNSCQQIKDLSMLI